MTQLNNPIPTPPPPRAESKPMTDDEFRSWALGEAIRASKANVAVLIQEWMRDAPDGLTLGAKRKLSAAMAACVDTAVKLGFEAGVGPRGPKVK